MRTGAEKVDRLTALAPFATYRKHGGARIDLLSLTHLMAQWLRIVRIKRRTTSPTHFRLKKWYDEHAEARPLYFAYLGPLDPKHVGLAIASLHGRTNIP